MKRLITLLTVAAIAAPVVAAPTAVTNETATMTQKKLVQQAQKLLKQITQAVMTPHTIHFTDHEKLFISQINEECVRTAVLSGLDKDNLLQRIYQEAEFPINENSSIYKMVELIRTKIVLCQLNNKEFLVEPLNYCLENFSKYTK
jgi:hypothetical protein